ncbi:MAG: ribosomal-protein-alanine acetyltransferase [Phenylobacterium sp.]|nr:ribosomal-protein-alanine acetyltransferase [Phenylobacterium sp.]
MNLVWATPGHAAALAAVHAAAFNPPWGASAFDELMAASGVFALLADEDPAVGMILCRLAAGEMEVLTVGVCGAARRRGVARALMVAAIGAARQAGAEAAFLEVAVDNAPAVGLYESLGFARAGRRPGYYDRGTEGRTDALVMRLDLNTAAA